MPFELKPGQGTLHRTNEKKTENSPDYFGEINVGGTVYRLGGWIKISTRGGKWLSLSIEEPRPPAAALERRPVKAPAIDPDDDIPFS